MDTQSGYTSFKPCLDLARIAIADNELGALRRLHGDMRAASGDDLVRAKAKTALRQVIGAPPQGEDQFVETAAVFAPAGPSLVGRSNTKGEDLELS